ncbi:MAG TPA: 50S ribosomal protein L23 [Candidatus Saccharimonadales bacterium]|nr:50S ribosomal protein L23 [Candidatus Saccharimonadales bacterium]
MSLIGLKPRLSEKSYGLSQNGTYVFDVPSNANKLAVANAVVEQYGVTVMNVNIANIDGKAKRTFLNRRGKFVRGTRSDVKKAYVTLKEGDSIPIFAAEEEAEAKAKKVQEKVAKKASKEKK